MLLDTKLSLINFDLIYENVLIFKSKLKILIGTGGELSYFRWTVIVNKAKPFLLSFPDLL